jgi:hypothetical protein
LIYEKKKQETPEANKKWLRLRGQNIRRHEIDFGFDGLKVPLENKKRLKHQGIPKHLDFPAPLCSCKTQN